MALSFIIPHGEESDNDGNPVEVIGENRAVGRRVLPAEQGVEDTPSSSTANLGVAAL